MDWSQARNFLIVTFVVMDLLLGYEVWLGYRATPQPPSAQQVLSELPYLGLQVSTALPTAPRKLPSLQLQWQKGQQAADNVLGGSGVVQGSYSDGRTVYERGTQAVTVGPNGTIRYTDSSVMTQGGHLSSAGAWKKAESFLKKRGFWPTEVTQRRLLPVSGTSGYTAEFTGMYDNIPIYGAKLSVEVFPAGVRSFTSWCPRVAGTADSKPLLSAAQALLQLAAVLPNSQGPTVVTGIQLGFYAGAGGSSTASPAWRVQTNDGAMYYVNAWTGRLDQ